MKKSIRTPSCRLRGATVALLVGSMLGLAASAGAQTVPSQEFPMKIRMHVDGQVATATLYDNAAARDFAALLPLSLTLTDYARIERIGYLPRKLAREDALAGVPVKAGDLAYYAPWGNLAIFVENGDGDYSGGLVQLGRVEAGLPALQRPGPLKLRIERMAD
ncbi:cyclophilin-like fold protein [Cupriavidus sp. D39]|uniref:cyclophilin-like fold protein n=1 Tax=Cupriavidus sp. D39 TaxID=2997877 RepID=UPI002272038B|nr:cyclophilin-like fold protein [Cupriavidus sp. D39]MCY0853463.1 cyclophilin-like fold protein [Cupriavidus sp. D39]